MWHKLVNLSYLLPYPTGPAKGCSSSQSPPILSSSLCLASDEALAVLAASFLKAHLLHYKLPTFHWCCELGFAIASTKPHLPCVGVQGAR